MKDVTDKQRVQAFLNYAMARLEISKKSNLNDIEYWQKQVNELTDKLEEMGE